MAIEPELGVSRAASRYSSVLLPEPGRADDERERPLGNLERDTAQGVDVFFAADVALLAGRTRESWGRSRFEGRRNFGLVAHDASLRIASMGVIREARQAG